MRKGSFESREMVNKFGQKLKFTEHILDKNSMERSHFLIKLTMEVYRESHSGYCSDPGEFHTENTTEIMYIPIPDNLYDEEVDESGVIKIYPLPDCLKTYENKETMCCRKNSLRRKIKNAEIVVATKRFLRFSPKPRPVSRPPPPRRGSVEHNQHRRSYRVPPRHFVNRRFRRREAPRTGQSPESNVLTNFLGPQSPRRNPQEQKD